MAWFVRWPSSVLLFGPASIFWYPILQRIRDGHCLLVGQDQIAGTSAPLLLLSTSIFLFCSTGLIENGPAGLLLYNGQPEAIPKRHQPAMASQKSFFSPCLAHSFRLDTNRSIQFPCWWVPPSVSCQFLYTVCTAGSFIKDVLIRHARKYIDPGRPSRQSVLSTMKRMAVD